jgi:hypothetical protein
LLVPAGKPVDGALASLGDVLAAGDVIMDGGNEWFENTVGWGSARAKKHIIIWSFFLFVAYLSSTSARNPCLASIQATPTLLPRQPLPRHTCCQTHAHTGCRSGAKPRSWRKGSTTWAAA